MYLRFGGAPTTSIAPAGPHPRRVTPPRPSTKAPVSVALVSSWSPPRYRPPPAGTQMVQYAPPRIPVSLVANAQVQASQGISRRAYGPVGRGAAIAAGHPPAAKAPASKVSSASNEVSEIRAALARLRDLRSSGHDPQVTLSPPSATERMFPSKRRQRRNGRFRSRSTPSTCVNHLPGGVLDCPDSLDDSVPSPPAELPPPSPACSSTGEVIGESDVDFGVDENDL